MRPLRACLTELNLGKAQGPLFDRFPRCFSHSIQGTQALLCRLELLARLQRVFHAVLGAELQLREQPLAGLGVYHFFELVNLLGCIRLAQLVLGHLKAVRVANLAACKLRGVRDLGLQVLVKLPSVQLLAT